MLAKSFKERGTAASASMMEREIMKCVNPFVKSGPADTHPPYNKSLLGICPELVLIEKIYQEQP
jgi:hypothetical protein